MGANNHPTVVPTNYEPNNPEAIPDGGTAAMPSPDTGVLQPEPMEKVRFYVPTSKPGSEEVAEEVVRKLSDLFGGATRYKGAEGSYVTGDAELLVEEVSIIESFGTAMSRDELRLIAEDVKAKLGEETVVFELTNTATQFV